MAKIRAEIATAAAAAAEAEFLAGADSTRDETREGLNIEEGTTLMTTMSEMSHVSEGGDRSPHGVGRGAASAAKEEGRQGSHAGSRRSGVEQIARGGDRSHSWSGEEEYTESRASSRGSTGKVRSRGSESASGSTGDGGIRRLVKQGGELLSTLPQRDYEDISSNVLKSSSPVAVALRRGM